MLKSRKNGSLESYAKKRRIRTNLESVIFSTLAISGMVTFAMMAPNAVRLLKHMDTDWVAKRDPKQRLYECMARMRRKELIRFDEKTRRYALTGKGRRAAQKVSTEQPLPVPKRWDGSWRMVIFDIAEKRKPLRRHIARLVAQLGFYRLQDSVWVHPSDCEEIISLIKLEKHIGTELRYVIAVAIEYDKPLREHFGLPLER